MAMFNSYVCLPEGNPPVINPVIYLKIYGTRPWKYGKTMEPQDMVSMGLSENMTLW